MRLTGIDHLVLTVADVEATCSFYADVLDAEIRTFGDGRRALGIGDQKINLHPAGDEFEPKAARPTPGSGDFCLVASGPIDEVVDRLEAADVDLVRGPTDQPGARGPMTSVYIRDPDGNLVEIATYADRPDA